jgi:hypothetical protein
MHIFEHRTACWLSPHTPSGPCRHRANARPRAAIGDRNPCRHLRIDRDAAAFGPRSDVTSSAAKTRGNAKSGLAVRYPRDLPFASEHVFSGLSSAECGRRPGARHTSCWAEAGVRLAAGRWILGLVLRRSRNGALRALLDDKSARLDRGTRVRDRRDGVVPPIRRAGDCFRWPRMRAPGRKGRCCWSSWAKPGLASSLTPPSD